jgi:hypothetical protein
MSFKSPSCPWSRPVGLARTRNPHTPRWRTTGGNAREEHARTMECDVDAAALVPALIWNRLPAPQGTRRCAAEQRDELASLQFIELHSVPCQPNCRISNWRGSVRGYQAVLATSLALTSQMPQKSASPLKAQITNVEPGKSLASPGLAQPNCARIWEVIRPRRDPVRVGC